MGMRRNHRGDMVIHFGDKSSRKCYEGLLKGGRGDLCGSALSMVMGLHRLEAYATGEETCGTR